MNDQPEPTTGSRRWRVSVYHNSLWARYKGAIYSALYRQSRGTPFEFSFVHIAERDSGREALSGLDLSYHQYPYRVLLRGASHDHGPVHRALRMTRDLLEHPSDLVILSGYSRLEHWMMLGACMLLGRRRIVACDSTALDRPREPLRSLAKRFFFGRCDASLGYGQRSRDYLLSHGAREGSVFVPCQAAALPHDYDAAQVMALYRGALPWKERPPRFLFVGRLAPEKGLRDLIAAFANVRNRTPGAQLHLVGAGPAEADLRRRIASLSLGDAVILHGARELREIVPLFFECEALVLPSHSEPWGLVVNEALSYGCPVVTSRHCGCVPELVQAGVTGYAFDTGNIEALAAALEAVRALSRDRVATARRCLEVMAAHSPEHAAARMLDACRHVLNGRPSPVPARAALNH